MTEREEKLQRFAELLQSDTVKDFESKGYNPSPDGPHFESGIRVSIKEGRKYTKVDRGTSGKYMIDADGNIWGIKGYGVIHFGHNYGTLDTINEWFWGAYVAHRKG